MGRPKLKFCPKCGADRKETRKQLRLKLKEATAGKREILCWDLHLAVYGQKNVSYGAEMAVYAGMERLGWIYAPLGGYVWVNCNESDKS